MTALRKHVEVEHHQGDAAHDGTDELVAQWHDWEHRPTGGYPTGLDHAHDEVTARRHHLPLTQVQA